MTRKNRQDPAEFKSQKRADLRGRYGEALKAHPELMDLIENYVDLQADAAKYRDQIDELEARIPEGARVLTAEESALLESYVALGKPEALKAQLEAGEASKAEKAKLERQITLSTAATTLGWDPDVLSTIDTLSGGLTLEVRETKDKDGKPVKAVLHKGADGKEVPLQEYVQASHAKLLPSLTAGSQPQAPQVPQRPFVPQRPTGDQPGAKTDEEIKAEKRRTVHY